MWSVSQDATAAECAGLGAKLATGPEPTALLVMGDGSARRSRRAPGYLDDRAAAFDAAVEQAIRSGHMASLLAIDPGLARDLMATGRPAWQALAAALGEATLSVDVQYAGDPFGVWYIAASLLPTTR
ncbi:MAG TPA: hypothetical protein VG253_02200 [Streptosporangiaceae bacterium]|jgi:hypothetical protein|nr:hypothetical protein [Streptosporangiaceae bacterium]